jgi:aspartyl-tRNA(Asn)/glutamyl-tRNA(Gln) amidotransferase subunit B
MRGKEESHDYRYFPDPDLIPITVTADWVERLRADLPELPVDKRKRFLDQYGLPANDADVLTSSRELADYFEAVVQGGVSAKAAGNWIMSELLRELKEDDTDIGECPVAPGQLSALIKMIEQGKISGKIAKSVFQDMYRSGEDPHKIVADKGLALLSDTTELAVLIDDVLAANPSQVQEYRAGKEKLLGFFVGQIMKKTKGQADPHALNDLLKEKLQA